MKIKIIFTGLFFLFFFCSPVFIIAQTPGDPCPDPALPDCPIDSNLIVLVIGAVVIAAKKAYEYNKNTQLI